MIVYLQISSCHHSHTKTGLAYGLGLRIRGICEKDDDYYRHRKELTGQLRKRGYAGRFVESQLQRVDSQKRETLLEPKPKSAKQSRVPLVMTFSKLLPDARNILRKHSKVLYRSDRMKGVFDELPILAYRRDKNLCDVLVHSKTARLVGSGSDGSKGSCKVCQALHEDEVLDAVGNQAYQPLSKPACTLRNVVYALLCEPCRKTVYVGETERSVKERIGEHLRDVMNQTEKTIMRHFSGHTVEDVRFVVLQCLGKEGIAYKQLVEEKWIVRMGTKIPSGCNVQLSF